MAKLVDGYKAEMRDFHRIQKKGAKEVKRMVEKVNKKKEISEHYQVCWAICKWLVRKHPKILEEFVLEETHKAFSDD